MKYLAGVAAIAAQERVCRAKVWPDCGQVQATWLAYGSSFVDESLGPAGKLDDSSRKNLGRPPFGLGRSSQFPSRIHILNRSTTCSIASNTVSQSSVLLLKNCSKADSVTTSIVEWSRQAAAPLQ